MSAIESIIQDYTVGAQRDCFFGGRKIELAERARKELEELRERAEKAEWERDNWTRWFEEERDKLAHAHHRIDDLEEDRETYCARLARYEAPGPALREAGPGERWHNVVNRAYREQHARCVAVVKRELAKSAATVQQQPTPYWRGGEDAMRNVLAALTGEEAGKTGASATWTGPPVCLACGGPRDKAESDHCEACEGP